MGVCECMCVCLCGYAIVLLGVYGVYMYYAKNMDEYCRTMENTIMHNNPLVYMYMYVHTFSI